MCPIGMQGEAWHASDPPMLLIITNAEYTICIAIDMCSRPSGLCCRQSMSIHFVIENPAWLHCKPGKETYQAQHARHNLQCKQGMTDPDSGALSTSGLPFPFNWIGFWRNCLLLIKTFARTKAFSWGPLEPNFWECVLWSWAAKQHSMVHACQNNYTEYGTCRIKTHYKLHSSLGRCCGHNQCHRQHHIAQMHALMVIVPVVLALIKCILLIVCTGSELRMGQLRRSFSLRSYTVKRWPLWKKNVFRHRPHNSRRDWNRGW